jgi:glycosyltransferase involved in cell wall biosynthesis
MGAMHILFVHRAFPAQFGRLALELTRRYGWQCTCLFQHLSRCPTPTPEMFQHLRLCRIEGGPEPFKDAQTPWPQVHGRTLDLGRAVFETVRALGIRPDLVVGHGGLTPTLFLRELLDCPLVDYCEYYFAPRGRDLTYRVDLAPVEPELYFPRCINAATLLNLAAADSGLTPTQWQRQSFPERWRSKIEVHFDGIDTDLYRPREVPRRIAGEPIPAETRIVTFAARGLESMRGFDLFVQVARRVMRETGDVIFVVAGDDGVYYGWDCERTGGQSFKDWALERADVDRTRFVFLGQVEPEELARTFCLSDLHIYLTVPFVLSWSFFDALACGCVVLASDVPSVREVVATGRDALLEPLFDVDRLAETTLRVLNNPAEFRPLGQAGRESMSNHYGIDACLPLLKDYLERVANHGKSATTDSL